MSAIQEEVVVPRLKALVADDSNLACFVLGRMLERLEPVLREQRDQIRGELLAEFALLENGQESVRRQVLRRVEESTHAMARRLERELQERIERRLAELPAALASADAATDAYSLRDDGLGSDVLEPAPAGVGCTPGGAPSATQRMAALAIN
jgi:hypothetical protein